MSMVVAGGTAEAYGEGSIQAVVIRCGCGDPARIHPGDNPCPTPRAMEDLGTISYWHRDCGCGDALSHAYEPCPTPRTAAPEPQPGRLARWLAEMKKAWREGQGK